MVEDVYRELARYLDNLPGGFPTTESGVELRILRRLFTPEAAWLTLHLTLIPEEPRVVARRAGLPVRDAAQRLEEMAGKGLIFRIQPPGKPARYQAVHFLVGIWEWQLNNLDPDFVRDMEAYLPSLIESAWAVPQLRTIPVGESLDTALEILPYEQAAHLVRAQKRLAVAPCICRRERTLLGEGCGRPEETCLVFWVAADYYVRNGLGRPIDQVEALSILEKAADAGLVLQPGNSQRPTNICACCGCCCAVLRNLKLQPQPAAQAASPFLAVLDTDACQGCGTCATRCQMEAVWLDNGCATLDLDRCIGCGLCVATCPTGALSLVRKPESAQPAVPKDITGSFIKLGQARGKMGLAELAGMQLRSKADRLLASR
jgi:electron transport complex protein RnfB